MVAREGVVPIGGFQKCGVFTSMPFSFAFPGILSAIDAAPLRSKLMVMTAGQPSKGNVDALGSTP